MPMRKHNAKSSDQHQPVNTDELSPSEEAKADLKAQRTLVYVVLFLLFVSVYICQQMQSGLFYWPAE